MTGVSSPEAAPLIAAIYARKSNEQTHTADESKSVTRQIENARAYAERKGWQVADEHTYVDDGISGAEFAKRPGFVRLMASLKPRPSFDVLIMSEESRLGREQIEVSYAMKQLVTSGVRVFCYLADAERTLDSPLEKAMLALQTMADEMEREKARQRVTDAMTHRAHKAHWLGGYVFGYDRVEEFEEGTDDAGRRRRRCVRLAVNETEAAAIRRVFELSALGVGRRRLAKQLNAEGVIAPKPKQRRPRSWSPSSIGEILRRDLYRGLYVWNRRQKRNQWGQQRPQVRDESQWVRVPAPELRIVDDALWAATHERLATSRQNYLRYTDGKLWGRPTNGAESKHLLTGMAICGVCGGGLLARGRRYGAERGYFYTCSSFLVRGSCSNDLEISREMADKAVLDLLEHDLLTPDVITAAIAKLTAAEAEPKETAKAKRRRLETAIAKLDAELARLADAIAAGGSSTLAAGIRDRETQRQRLQAELRATETLSAKPAADRITAEALRHLDEWRGLLGQDTLLARQLLRKLLDGRLVFAPKGSAGERWYEFSGQGTLAKFLADVPSIKAVVPVRGFEPRSRG